MLPVFKPGDHVLTFNWGKIKVGDVVVFKMSKDYFIKRVVKIGKHGQGKVYNKLYDYIYIRGDNKAKSAKMKPVLRTQIVGEVVFKY